MGVDDSIACFGDTLLAVASQITGDGPFTLFLECYIPASGNLNFINPARDQVIDTMVGVVIR